MNYKELLVDASKQLKYYKFNSAKLDAELILSKTLGLSREKILLIYVKLILFYDR